MTEGMPVSGNKLYCMWLTVPIGWFWRSEGWVKFVWNTKWRSPCSLWDQGCQGSCSLSFPWGDPAAQELLRALLWLHNWVLLPCPDPALPKKSPAISAEQAASWELCCAGAQMLEQWRGQCGTWVRSGAALIFFFLRRKKSLFEMVLFPQKDTKIQHYLCVISSHSSFGTRFWWKTYSSATDPLLEMWIISLSTNGFSYHFWLCIVLSGLTSTLRLYEMNALWNLWCSS